MRMIRTLIAEILLLTAMLSSPLFAAGNSHALVVGGGRTYSLGPTGLWGQGQEEHFIIQRVEVDSPAFGLVLKHDVIRGVNGQAFPREGDIRVPFGHAILDSQAKDGGLVLQIERAGSPIEVTVQLDKMPDFSPTWPFDCKRTGMMLSKACEYLAREQLPEGFVPADDGKIGGAQAGLLFLATGDPEYLENARRAAYWLMDYMQGKVDRREGFYFGPWFCGYAGLTMAEYYEMTGDRGILPGLEIAAKAIADGQMPSGGWSHNFYGGYGAGYGEVNNAGMISYMTLILCKEIGIKVDEAKLKKADRYFETFAPNLTNMYGDFIGGFQGYESLNGKVGGASVAHRLRGNKIHSANYALKAARCSRSIIYGHTGHYFNTFWTPVAGSLAPAKDYRRLMDQLTWYYALSQNWRGGFYCQPGETRKGGSKYSEGSANMTTAGLGLGLAVAHRRLRILGAPKGAFIRELPPELQKARAYHAENKWDEAIAAVDTYLKKDGLTPADVQLAYDLRDKIRYVKAGFEKAMVKLNKMTRGRLDTPVVKVDELLKSLRRVMGEDHPDLAAIEERLPERHRKLWTRAREYYDTMNLLKALYGEVWFLHSKYIRRSFPNLEAPFGEPEWTAIATMEDKPGNWRVLDVADAADAPRGWSDPGFDDKNWAGAASFKPRKIPRRRRDEEPNLAYQMVRVAFDLDEVSAKQLRVVIQRSGGSCLWPGAEVYLNGKLVVDLLDRRDRGGIELLRSTPALLRKGRNLLAFATPSEGGLTRLALEAELPKALSTFEWTAVPGRDVEIRKLTAKRTGFRDYYNPDKDTRTIKDLLAAFQSESSFMPEIHCAMQRYNVLAPSVQERSKHIAELLKSSAWGGRWTAVHMIQQLQERGEDQAVAAVLEKHKAGLIARLKDPHPLVRFQAAEAIAKYGDSAKAAIPALVAMTSNYDGETWWTRGRALGALNQMSIDGATVEAFMRAGLNDPAANVRRPYIETAFVSTNQATRVAAFKTYKDEAIDQIFTVPDSMFTGGMRKRMAQWSLENLSKDELRPYLPRFFKALADPKGSTLQGSQMILVAFGDEVRDKLEELAASDKDEMVRFNSIQTLQMMALQDDASPELVGKVKKMLLPLTKVEDLKRADWAEKLLKALDAKK